MGKCKNKLVIFIRIFHLAGMLRRALLNIDPQAKSNLPEVDELLHESALRGCSSLTIAPIDRVLNCPSCHESLQEHACRRFMIVSRIAHANSIAQSSSVRCITA